MILLMKTGSWVNMSPFHNSLVLGCIVTIRMYNKKKKDCSWKMMVVFRHVQRADGKIQMSLLKRGF